MKKIIYVAIFIIIGIVYMDLGESINEILIGLLPWLRIKSFFFPMILIDVIIGIFYIEIFNIITLKKKWLYLLQLCGYLLIAISVSVITTFGFGMFRFMVGMSF